MKKIKKHVIIFILSVTFIAGYAQTTYLTYDGSNNVATGQEPLSLISILPGISSNSPAITYRNCHNFSTGQANCFALSYSTSVSPSTVLPNSTTNTAVGFTMTNSAGGSLPIDQIEFRIQRYTNAGTPSNVKISYNPNSGGWISQSFPITSGTSGTCWTSGSILWTLSSTYFLPNGGTFEVLLQPYGGSLWCAHYEVIIDAAFVRGLIVLPVELVDFTAVLESASSVNLKWQTSSEKNSKEFVIERSLDAVNFSPIEKIPASGNSNEKKNYSISDNNLPVQDTWYYRILSIDQDGSSRPGNLVSVSRKKVEAPTESIINLYPNPSSDLLNVSVKSLESFDMYIYDINGNKIEAIKQYVDDGIQLDIRSLNPGIYLLVVQGSSGIETKRFVKQ